MRRFTDRAEAGRALADLLAAMDLADPVVLALPRGGVPVGVEIARRLRAPLDLVMVRKIGVPGQPEVAAGAVVDGDNPEIVVNAAIAAFAGLDRDAIAALAQEQLREIARRRDVYLKGRARVRVAGRTAIVVDDGVATGATMRAALRAVRRRKPARLVLAVPVAAPEALEEMESAVDDIVCAHRPEYLGAIGAFYLDFTQVEDSAVVAQLDEAARIAPDDRNGAPAAI